VFSRAGVSFGILGSDELCDGNEVAAIGEEGLFEHLARTNIERFRERGVRKVLVLSPHAFNAMKNLYPGLGGDVEVVHASQLMARLLREGRLQPRETLSVRVTYHDPCLLGRLNSEYDAPRRILKRLPGVELVEMPRSKASALCCGGGGGNAFTDLLGGGEDSPARIRVRQARDTGAQVLATACPTCLVMLEDAVKSEGFEETLAIRDVSELVADAVL
jgi:Fe-S oxidoreductase